MNKTVKETKPNLLLWSLDFRQEKETKYNRKINKICNMFDVGKENSLIGKGVSMDWATILDRVLGGVLLK